MITFDLNIYEHRVRLFHACAPWLFWLALVASLSCIYWIVTKRERVQGDSSRQPRLSPLDLWRDDCALVSFLLVLRAISIITPKVNAILPLLSSNCVLYPDNALLIYFLGRPRSSLEKSKYIDAHVKESGINRTTVNVTWSIQAWKKQPAFFK